MGTRPVSGFASRVQTSPGIAECELQNRYQEQLACMQQLLDAKAAWKLMEDDGAKGCCPSFIRGTWRKIPPASLFSDQSGNFGGDVEGGGTADL